MFVCFLVPSMDKSLQPASGPVLGPLWISRGEGFSPKGAHTFLTTMIQNTKDRIKTTKIYLNKVCWSAAIYNFHPFSQISYEDSGDFISNQYF